MKSLRIFLLAAMLIFAVSVIGQEAKSAAAAAPPAQAAPTLASAIDREISAVEK